MAYELAFHPARLNAVWNEWEQQHIPDPSALRAVVEWAVDRANAKGIDK